MSETPYSFGTMQLQRTQKELEHVTHNHLKASRRVQALEAENKRLKNLYETTRSELRVVEQTKEQYTLWLLDRGDEIERLNLEIIRLKKQLEN